MIIRSMSFGVIVCVGFFLPFWMFVIAAALYMILWRGYEILLIAAIIDIQFGVSTLYMAYGYLYTISAGVLLVATTCIRPYMWLDH